MKRNKNIKNERKKQELISQLKYAKTHYKQIKDFFYKTVLPFYEAIQEPSEEKKHLRRSTSQRRVFAIGGYQPAQK